MSVSAKEFRSVMSLYPSGVCVVSTQIETQPPFGLTVNSFTSLSLEPALVMWNLQKSSDTYKTWHDAEYFAVNMLRADQDHLAKRFAIRGHHGFEKGELARGETGCPLLADCHASLECVVHARYEEGDHVILMGEVLNVIADSDAAPLTYCQGTYGTLQANRS